MAFDILTVPDERLKQPSGSVQEFNAELRQFVQALEQTMRNGPGGVGIAASQVGRFQRIAIVDVSSKPKIKHNGCMVLINPQITHWEDIAKGREGCMSVPDFTGDVIRAECISIEAYDVNGMLQQYHCEGYEARAVQHEVNHMDKILFLDRLVSRRTDLFPRKVYKK